jgi:short subunit dehydrogenase-like uncharacterized protein
MKKFDIVLLGATGFTGKLILEHLVKNYEVPGDFKLAVAGRNLEKLDALCRELDLPQDIGQIVVDNSDPASLRGLVGQAGLVISSVGPYQLYGSGLVAACAETGTDYVDLCGEPPWMREMIQAHEDTAKQSGARIVFSCGFDSIPFDMGVFFLQQRALRKFGSPCGRVKGRVRKITGSVSGGTVASIRATYDLFRENPEAIATLTGPFALTPGFAGPKQPSGRTVVYDDDLQSWATPFVMAEINTKNVHRSNYLLGHPYGQDFQYDEMILTGDGPEGEALANKAAARSGIENLDIKPGEGPSEEERLSGFYEILFAGTTADNQTVRVSVGGDEDPGYQATSSMIAEAALGLVDNPQVAGGGIWTPAAALGDLLLERLQNRTKMRFREES